MEIITAKEVMDKLDIFQSRFGEIDEYGWCALEIVSSDARTQFSSTKFQDECKTHGVHLDSAALEHQEMNGQVKVTRRTLRTISHSLMLHARVFEAYISFALMFMSDDIFPLLPTKDLINEDGEPVTPFKLVTVIKPAVSHLRVPFFHVLCENILHMLVQRR